MQKFQYAKLKKRTCIDMYNVHNIEHNKKVIQVGAYLHKDILYITI